MKENFNFLLNIPKFKIILKNLLLASIFGFVHWQCITSSFLRSIEEKKSKGNVIEYIDSGNLEDVKKIDQNQILIKVDGNEQTKDLDADISDNPLEVFPEKSLLIFKEERVAFIAQRKIRKLPYAMNWWLEEGYATEDNAIKINPPCRSFSDSDLKTNFGKLSVSEPINGISFWLKITSTSGNVKYLRAFPKTQCADYKEAVPYTGLVFIPLTKVKATSLVQISIPAIGSYFMPIFDKENKNQEFIEKISYNRKFEREGNYYALLYVFTPLVVVADVLITVFRGALAVLSCSFPTGNCKPVRYFR